MVLSTPKVNYQKKKGGGGDNNTLSLFQ